MNHSTHHCNIIHKFSDRLSTHHFHTLRHWKATIEYHKTKNVVHIMKPQKILDSYTINKLWRKQ